MTSNVNGDLSVHIAHLTEGEPSQSDPEERSGDVYKSVTEIEEEDDQVFPGSDAISVPFQTNEENDVHLETVRLVGETLSSEKNLQVPNENSNVNEVLRHDGSVNNAAVSISHSVSDNLSSVPVVTTSTGTTRRPSYTSKAPSALNTLPGITISDFSPVRSTFDASHGSSHPPTQVMLNHSPGRRGPTLASLRQVGKDGLNRLSSFQSSFDESIDGYSNPGTPSSVRTDSPTPSPSGTHKRDREAREKNRVSFKTKWDEAEKTDTLIIKCREIDAELHKNKLGSGSKGKCIKLGNTCFTPTEFEQYCGRGACKDWKRSIRYCGQTLQKLIEEGILAPHAVSCTCAICCGDDTLTGPVKLFVPYTKAKRKRRDGGGSVSKRFSTSGEDINIREMHRARSFSMDSEVFPSLAHHHLGDLNDDANMPPMTPVTPMTPITPMTPFTPATPLTPFPRVGSPPRHLSLSVPTGNPGGPPGHGSPAGLLLHGSQHIPMSIAAMTAFGRTPPTPTKQHANSSDNSLAVVNQHHWIQLEEMASSLISMAQQMRIMIEQAKVQAEALKESAVAQAKIQAESEKREAISQVRMQSIAQLSQALATAQAQQVAQAESKIEPGMQEQQRQQFAILKTCQNCSRDALLECTGCHRVYYCSQFCQRKDWINHQKMCGDQPSILTEQQQQPQQQPPQQQPPQQHPQQQHTPPPSQQQQGPPPPPQQQGPPA